MTKLSVNNNECSNAEALAIACRLNGGAFSVDDSILNLLDKGYYADAEMSYLYPIPSLALHAKSADWQPEPFKKSGERRASPTTAFSYEANQDFTVYPNPINAWLNISLPPTDKPVFIEFYTIEGKLVHSLTSYEAALSIDCSSIANGCYFLKIKSDAQQDFVRKINVLH